jgi:toxin ParE1/3/4
MAVRIFPAASGRLLEIWDYTEKKWGEEQADRYIRQLVAAAHELPGNFRSWRPVRDRVLKGVFFIRHRHHYIFFRRLRQGDLGVISILHENMDIPSRLKEDAGAGD